MPPPNRSVNDTNTLPFLVNGFALMIAFEGVQHNKNIYLLFPFFPSFFHFFYLSGIRTNFSQEWIVRRQRKIRKKGEKEGKIRERERKKMKQQ